MKTFAKSAKRKVDLSTIEWLPPEQGRWATAGWHRWPTACGRYYVYRVMSPAGEYPVEYAGTVKRMRDGSPKWDMISYDREKGVGYPKKYKTLDEAMESVEQYHATKNKLESVTSNRLKIVDAANEQGLAAATAASSDKRKRLQQVEVKRPQLIVVEQKKQTLSQAILSLLKLASREKPISNDDMVKRLAIDFPNWQTKSLRILVEKRVPQGLRDKGIRVKRSKGGCWIEN